ncbi:uncharacterized protein V1510DRAFT_415573 [Dipodascopsis tothii]|uniref:uncharacterized protein n=1 Tax=Dipodascopsis tothii TaxID=44089 RepID=UPI0034CD2174
MLPVAIFEGCSGYGIVSALLYLANLELTNHMLKLFILCHCRGLTLNLDATDELSKNHNIYALYVTALSGLCFISAYSFS